MIITHFVQIVAFVKKKKNRTSYKKIKIAKLFVYFSKYSVL